MLKRICQSLVLCLGYFLLTSWNIPVSAQTSTHSKPSAQQFVIDPNRPFVYLLFDHVAQSDPKCHDEPATRVWARLVNNSSVSIKMLASGQLETCHSDEVRIAYVVEPDRRGLEVGGPTDEPDSEIIPSGYPIHVGSEVQVLPGKSIAVSFPLRDLGKRSDHGKNWHVEIPFQFVLPKGKGPRDPVIGGEPSMVLIYSIWDVPEEQPKRKKK
jgi:hypothetical protein